MDIGIVGFGTRMSYLGKIISEDKELNIRAITDINKGNAIMNLEKAGISPESIVWFEDAEEMMDSQKLDGIIVSTRCNLHTQFAVMALKRNIPLFLEKPVSTTIEDLYILKDAYEKSSAGGVVSFPLRVTPHAKLAKELIDSGIIGKISQVQAINNVPYGRVYFKDWYRDERVTGGLFLQKATHDIDCINYLLGIKPVYLCAMKSKVIFKGDKPENLQCENCEEYTSCYESTYFIEKYKDGYLVGNNCSYAIDTGNEDSGSLMIMYQNGVHAIYTQNFIARQEAGKREIRIIGQTGTIEFDWYKNEVKFFSHNCPEMKIYKIKPDPKDPHGGGDTVLLQNFKNIMQGTKSDFGIEDGLLSALICLKAKKSSEALCYEEIKW